MSLEQIDELIVAWEKRLERVDENLLALEADAAYQALSGSTTARRAHVEGITKARVLPALDALIQLFEHRERLTEVLDRAKEVRASVSALTFWNTDDKLKEVQDLLGGPSIKMGTAPTPLAQRNLLDPAARDVAVVPEQLLNAMAQAYEQARDAVSAVQHAWETLEPTIEKVGRDVAELHARAKALGVDGAMAAELALVDGDVKALSGRIACDPLGVSGAVGGTLAPRIDALRQHLAAFDALRTRVTSELERARAISSRVRDVHEAAHRHGATCVGDFVEAGSLVPPADDALIAGLDPWLAKLESTVSAGRYHAAEVGLARWFETANACLAHDGDICTQVERLRAARSELSGRLSARRAQVRAISARGAPAHPHVEARARAVEECLARRPTPLAEASALLDAYESAVLSFAASTVR